MIQFLLDNWSEFFFYLCWSYTTGDPLKADTMSIAVTALSIISVFCLGAIAGVTYCRLSLPREILKSIIDEKIHTTT